MTIPLYDDFTNPLGEFVNYDTYDPGQRTQLSQQRHVDLRSFVQNPVYTPYTMFTLSSIQMGALEGQSMSALESNFAIAPGEIWSAGTVGAQSDRNNFNGISLSCSIGTTTTQSIMNPIDISAFGSSDYISVTLPAFPATSLDLTNTFIDLTSHPTGDFTLGPTDSLAFSTSTTTLSNTNCEARFLLSALTQVQRNQITGIRFRVKATTGCTFRSLAIRCLAATWQFAPVDLNTLYGRIGATVPPTGSLTQAYTFPAAASPVTPSDWPPLFFSDGTDGPRLVNVELGAVIETGAMTATNTLALYFREASFYTLPLSVSPQAMSDLQGQNMHALDEPMSAIEGLSRPSMGDLQALGRMPGSTPAARDDFTHTHFQLAVITWGGAGGTGLPSLTNLPSVTNFPLGGDRQVQLGDETGLPYTLPLELAANSSYYVLATLLDNSLRVRIYPISTNGTITWTPVFDSTALVDGNMIRRRPGRLGWYTQFNDGSSSISTLRPRRIVYGEYRSAPFPSETPVEGARLFTDATPDTDLYPGTVATNGARISADFIKSKSGHSIYVQCDGTVPLEGLISAQPMRLENLYDTEITFSVLAPTAAQLLTMLSGEGRLIPVPLPVIPAQHWTHVRLPLEQLGGTWMPGPYSLYIVQTQTGANAWYIDNLRVRVKSVVWEGRGQANDAWNMTGLPWIKFGDAINKPHAAALLGRGNALQVRGQAVGQTGNITGVKILPKYAELGNFIWADQALTYGSAPVSSFTATPGANHTVTCDGSASTASASILRYYWTFGDGSYAYGQTITHQYTAPGTYTINLTVIDSLTQKTSLTKTVVVS